MDQANREPDAVLQLLREGNERFCKNAFIHPRQSPQTRKALLSGQKPFASILTCSDSRVPPEIIFDGGIGDLFVIRNAGNILDSTVLGTLQYSTEHLGVQLILVLGHTLCSAITSAVKGGHSSGHIGQILEALRPAVESVRQMEGDQITNAVIENVRRIVHHLSCSEPAFKDLVIQKKIRILGCIYHLETGKVEFLES